MYRVTYRDKQHKHVTYSVFVKAANSTEAVALGVIAVGKSFSVLENDIELVSVSESQ